MGKSGRYRYLPGTSVGLAWDIQYAREISQEEKNTLNKNDDKTVQTRDDM